MELNDQVLIRPQGIVSDIVSHVKVISVDIATAHTAVRTELLHCYQIRKPSVFIVCCFCI